MIPQATLITSCFRPPLSQVKIAALQQRFALWFYTTGLAFNKAAHPTLEAAMRVLTPSAGVLTRKQLGTSLLDTTYDNFRSKMMLSTRVALHVNNRCVNRYQRESCGELRSARQ